MTLIIYTHKVCDHNWIFFKEIVLRLSELWLRIRSIFSLFVLKCLESEWFKEILESFQKFASLIDLAMTGKLAIQLSSVKRLRQLSSESLQISCIDCAPTRKNTLKAWIHWVMKHWVNIFINTQILKCSTVAVVDPVIQHFKISIFYFKILKVSVTYLLSLVPAKVPVGTHQAARMYLLRFPGVYSFQVRPKSSFPGRIATSECVEE